MFSPVVQELNEGCGLLPDSGGLGLPRIADRIEYSMFAASEPKVKLGSKGMLRPGSLGLRLSGGRDARQSIQ
jgi:hypothetical protein